MESFKQKCQVCLRFSASRNGHQNHFGGICCFSCAAFFRRLHRDKTSCLPASVRCLSDDCCNLAMANCRGCRHTRCIQIGMNPAKVISDTSERLRYTFPRRTSTKKQESKNDDDLKQPSSKNPAKIYMEKKTFQVDTIRKSFIRAHSEIIIDQRLADFLLRKFARHCNDFQMNSAVVQCLARVTSVFANIAWNNDSFKSLEGPDQGILIKKNTLLYKQYILAWYFAEKNGWDQLKWLLGPKIADVTGT